MKNPLNNRFKRQLKNDFAKYLVIFLLIVIMVALTSGFQAANNSVVNTIHNNEVLLKQQSGYFVTKKKLNKAQIDLFEKEANLKVYEEFYKEESIDNDTTFRFYKVRNEVDLQEVLEGRLPENANELAIERLYATNNNLDINDELTYKGITYKIVGKVSLVDYSCLFKSNSDMMLNAITFGVGLLTEDGFNRLNKEDCKYRYAYVFNDETLDDEFKDILLANSQLEEFVSKKDNKSITFVLEDAKSDSASMYIFLYLMMIMTAYIFSIIIINMIQKDATVIGTLMASGYSEHELIMHFMFMPSIITILGVVVGNILGYTVILNAMKSVYYNNYSLASFHTYFQVETFIYVSLVPMFIMFLINYLILKKTLKLSPLKFLRKDLSKHRQKRAIKLNHHIPFFSRFRTRIILQNKKAYLTLIVGIIFANLLLFFGLALPQVLSDYVGIASEGIIAPYQTILDMPISLSDSSHKLETSINLLNFANNVETDNEDAEKFSYYELKYTSKDYKEDDVALYGINKNSSYFKYNLKSNDCYISQGLHNKYGYNIGDYITLHEAYKEDTYTFKITGITDNNASLELYLDRNTLNDIFELGDDTFVGYFSSSPITDIDENYIGQVITASTMASISTQLLSSMGSMMNMFCYFAIIVFVIVLYLLSKLIIERNTLSISMSKILGYTNKEIARLYIISTTIVVIFASLISIPICYKPLLVMFYEMLYTQMSGWIPFIIDKGIGVKMVFMNIVVYMFVSIFEYRRINKVPMDEALKNVE